MRPKLRFEIFRRDFFTCRYCGRTPPAVILHVDHIVPRKDGGADVHENLVTACNTCNLGKGVGHVDPAGIPPPPGTPEDLEAAHERRRQITAMNEFMARVREDRDGDINWLVTIWQAASHWDDAEGQGWCDKIETAHRLSLGKFLNRLSRETIAQAVESACQRVPPPRERDDRFRYFCAICWSLIREQQGVDHAPL